MINDFSPSTVTGKERFGIYISVKWCVIILFFFIISLVVMFLIGAYLGMKEARRELARNQIQEEKDSYTAQETKQTTPTQPANNESPMIVPTTPNSPPETIETEPTTDKPPSEQTTIAQSSAEGGVEPTQTIPPTDTPSQTTTPEDVSSQSSQPVVLTPITPPIDQEIKKTSTEEVKPVSEQSTVETNIKQNPRTYSIQLSALTGDDAEKRARILVERLQKKYGKQFTFKIQPAGKFYKIIAINIHDEKTAREALQILSQEPDFKKAFIINPKK